ncbi:MAG: RsmE family RNA methyltransferase [Bacteroidia bacterium]
MNLFYFAQTTDNQWILPEEEAQHCIKVLRKKAGDEIVGIDGKGNYYTAEIRQLGKNIVFLEIINKVENWGESADEIYLFVSPLRMKDRFEWLIEKSVELGVTHIIPIICKRTITENIKTERLNNILISALKQCKRSRLPQLFEPIKFSKALPYAQSKTTHQYLAFCESTISVKHFAQEIATSSKLALFIGPEGDFSEEEVQLATNANISLISLGETRLRTETAGLFALSYVKAMKL